MHFQNQHAVSYRLAILKNMARQGDRAGFVIHPEKGWLSAWTANAESVIPDSYCPPRQDCSVINGPQTSASLSMHMLLNVKLCYISKDESPSTFCAVTGDSNQRDSGETLTGNNEEFTRQSVVLFGTNWDFSLNLEDIEQKDQANNASYKIGRTWIFGPD